jgi:hypothetical protein
MSSLSKFDQTLEDWFLPFCIDLRSADSLAKFDTTGNRSKTASAACRSALLSDYIQRLSFERLSIKAFHPTFYSFTEPVRIEASSHVCRTLQEGYLSQSKEFNVQPLNKSEISELPPSQHPD